MVRQKISGHFFAALGLGHVMDRAIEAYIRHFYAGLLREYHREIRYERARLMRQAPMDYRRVREMDRQLDEVTRLMRDSEAERARRS